MLNENPRDEFFDLLTTLLRDASKNTKPFVGKDLKTIVETLSQIIIECPSKEEYEMEDNAKKTNKTEADFLLRGSLNALSRILKKCREFEISVQVSDELFESVFQDCLFASPASSTSNLNVPKCKQSLTRSAAMYVVFESSIISLKTHTRKSLEHQHSNTGTCCFRLHRSPHKPDPSFSRCVASITVFPMCLSSHHRHHPRPKERTRTRTRTREKRIFPSRLLPL